MVKLCVVKSCPSGRKKIKKITGTQQALSYFQPRTAAKLDIWKKSMGIELKTTDYICQLHFKEEHIKMYEKLYINGELKLFPTGKKILKEEAMPTIEHQYVPLPIHGRIMNIIKVEAPKLECKFIRMPELKSHMTDVPEKLNSNCDRSNKLQQHSQHNNGDKPELLVCEPILNNLTDGNNEIQQDPLLIQQSKHDIKDHQDTKATIHSLDYFRGNIKNFSILPPHWMYVEKPNRLEFIRIDPTNMKLRNHICVNEDLSTSAILSNNDELQLNERITSFLDIYNYLKSIEKWPLCVGTQLDNNRFSKMCKGVIIGDDAYKRNQRCPRCMPCRTLRNRLQYRMSNNTMLGKKIAHKPFAENQMKHHERLKTMKIRLSDKIFMAKPEIKNIPTEFRNVFISCYETTKKPSTKGQDTAIESQTRVDQIKEDLIDNDSDYKAKTEKEQINESLADENQNLRSKNHAIIIVVADDMQEDQKKQRRAKEAVEPFGTG